MRVLFFVEGEGRGHMTQAISLAAVLENAGHSVVAVLVGTNGFREIPPFFRNSFRCPVQSYRTPALIRDRKKKGIRATYTIGYNFMRIPHYLAQVRFIQRRIVQSRPDVIVNFYDLLGALSQVLSLQRTPMVAVANQFMVGHPDYPCRGRTDASHRLYILLALITGWGSIKQLAMSLRELPSPPDSRLVVVPPLLRHGVLELQTSRQDYFLGYMLNQGYMEEVMAWHRRHPEVRLEFFWDNTDAPPTLEIDETLILHRLDDRKFLERLGRCAGLATTAGFQSVCEGFYLGKPLLLIPAASHPEQECNAYQAERMGIGVAARSFDLTRLLTCAPTESTSREEFRRWVHRAPELYLRHIEAAAKSPTGSGARRRDRASRV